MTTEGLLRMWMCFLFTEFKIRSVNLYKVYFLYNLSTPIVFSTGAAAEWRNLFLIYVTGSRSY